MPNIAIPAFRRVFFARNSTVAGEDGAHFFNSSSILANSTFFTANCLIAARNATSAASCSTSDFWAASCAAADSSVACCASIFASFSRFCAAATAASARCIAASESNTAFCAAACCVAAAACCVAAAACCVAAAAISPPARPPGVRLRVEVRAATSLFTNLERSTLFNPNRTISCINIVKSFIPSTSCVKPFIFPLRDSPICWKLLCIFNPATWGSVVFPAFKNSNTAFIISIVNTRETSLELPWSLCKNAVFSSPLLAPSNSFIFVSV